MRPTMAVGFTVDAALIAMMLVGTWMYKGAGNLWRLVLNQVHPRFLAWFSPMY